MMSRRALLAGLAAVLPLAAGAAEPATIAIGYVERADDPDYAPRRSYETIRAASIPSPFPGASLALSDAKLIGAAVGLSFKLQRVTLAEGDDAAKVIRALTAAQGAVAIILDLPLEETAATAKALAELPIALFNARHHATSLRQSACATQLFHTMPSADMLTDALAQGLAKRNWTRVLMLASDDAEDMAGAATFLASATKFGLTIAGSKVFAAGNDPRDRERNNPRLLTGDADYDVVFLADHAGDFARLLPYNTALPRPIIGAAGLVATAWHPYWERQGAPQLNHRFEKAANHPMSERDWSTWVAVRAIVEASVRGKARGAADLIPALLDPALTLELYKGSPGSFRRWNRQLRQPILLASETAVVGLAPVEGMLHQTNTLDTLGQDEPEAHCP